MVYEFNASPRLRRVRVHPLNSDRKSIKRRQRLREQVNITEINELPQIRDLVVSFFFIDIDVPGLWPPLIAGTPAIAAFFQLVFEVERGLFSPDPNCLSAGILEQQ